MSEKVQLEVLPANTGADEVTAEQVTALNANGFDGVIGLRYTELSADRVRGEWTVGPSLHQAYGVVHGGVYSAVVESLASTAAWTWLNRAGTGGGVVGVNNNTDFLRSVTRGTLHAEATPIHRGRLQQIWQVVITDDRSRLVARGQVRLQNLGS
ncbi:MAG: thioesterase [Nocardia sp.]|uniref:PaaI family thioesterase n=1 Tax=Nocardia sp. TaxID=1821 RepID=UPI00263426E7|nr:PaaI family thioesterase [Nocardia sp.]MCU1648040.1 thioesterase [Nocardia sp.]